MHRSTPHRKPKKPIGHGSDGHASGQVTPIIADRGARAELLLVPSGPPMTVGARFQHLGSWWLITERRRDSGLMVAEPTLR
jgi:hypothetical protein